MAGWGDTQEQWEAIQALKVSGGGVTGLAARLGAGKEASIMTSVVQNLFPADVVSQCGATTSLWIPLRRGEELVGALSLEYRGRAARFNLQQERLAQGIGTLAALVLANKRLLQELTHANRIKSDFLASLSHELRTPLHIILGYTSCLLEDDLGLLTVEPRKALQAVDRSARELLELIVAMLEASQIETERPQLERTEVDVAELIAELQQEIEHIPDRSTLSFTWRVAPALPRLYTDRIKLAIILKNLLSNAVKFTPTGSIVVEVSLQGRGIEFWISDTGVGIAPELMPVIFELFRQGDSSATRRHKGIGLGLYIVRQMLGVLGGTIMVESKAGQGSTFRVWLPVERRTLQNER
jgi:signal transduction histidine kinase